MSGEGIFLLVISYDYNLLKNGNIINFEWQETGMALKGSFKAHQDVLSCVRMNPCFDLIASCSGERKFHIETEDESLIDYSIKLWKSSLDENGCICT